MSRQKKPLIRRLIISRGVALAFGLLTAIALAEAAATILHNAASRFRRGEDQAALHPVPDERLGHRIPPFEGGQDANGFRNDQEPNQADVVALGDSMTWGFCAHRREAWPQTLERITGRSVYNLGVGGYGPIQYLELLDLAFSKKPQCVVAMIYLGNDLYDAYKMAYHSPAHARFRKPDATAELFQDVAYGPEAGRLTSASKEALTTNEWMINQSRLVGLLHAHGIWPGRSLGQRYLRDKSWALAHPDEATVFETDASCTVLVPRHRLIGLDLDDPRIAEGLRITTSALNEIAKRCHAKQVELVVVLLPTKESIHAPLLSPAGTTASWSRLVEMESKARTALANSCDRWSVQCFDLGDALTEQVRRGQKLYRASSDSHPICCGYQVMAREIASRLESRLFTSTTASTSR